MAGPIPGAATSERWQMIEHGKPGQTVTRAQLARFELEAAIRNLFIDEDLIAAHLLTWSALEVISDVGKARGRVTLRTKMASKFSPEVRQRWRRAEHDHYNFMKHADRDPDRTIRLAPDMTFFALHVSCRDFQTVFDDLSPVMAIYIAWYLRQNPEMCAGFDADYINAVVEAVRERPKDAWADAKMLIEVALKNPDLTQP